MIFDETELEALSYIAGGLFTLFKLCTMALKTIEELVANRLPYLTLPSDLASDFKLEVYYELSCYNGIDINDVATIEDDATWTGIWKSLVADIVACYMLLNKSVDTVTSSVVGGGAGKILKAAKAGSVEVEFEQLQDKGNFSIKVSTEGLLAQLKAAAARKARKLGFILDICGDCSIAIEMMRGSETKPFCVVKI